MSFTLFVIFLGLYFFIPPFFSLFMQKLILLTVTVNRSKEVVHQE